MGIVSAFVTAAVAEGTDFAVSIEADARVAQPRVTYVVHTTWAGTEPAQDVVLELDVPGDVMGLSAWDGYWKCNEQRPIRCTGAPRAAHTGGVTVSARMANVPAFHTFTARLTSKTPDPRPENNTAQHVVEVTALPELSPEAHLPFGSKSSFDPGETMTIRLAIGNYGATASDVTFAARLPEGVFLHTEQEWTSAETPPSCSLTVSEVICRMPKLDTQEFAVVRVDLLAPSDRTSGGKFRIDVSADAAEEDFGDGRANHVDVQLRRQFRVTHAGDDGEGSLREAMIAATAMCEDEPCTIDLTNVTSPMQPRTALPRLRGRIKVAGGDAKAVLDGSLLTDGDALHYETGCEFLVHRLVIRNFPGHAIEAHQIQPHTNRCPLLLDAVAELTDNELSNNLRGIVTKSITAEITGNVIRDHRRAGIFVDDTGWTLIRDNTITGNGASGVFIDAADSAAGIPAGATITANVIRGNGHFGVARTERGLVQVERNEIAGNLYYGIDLNLDLDTPNRSDDAHTTPNKPLLFDAAYDPASNTTLVRGRVESASAGLLVLDFYASSALSVAGYPEAERWMAESLATPETREIDVVLPGDLRGQWITATSTRPATVYFSVRPTSGGTTSELSHAVKVQ